MANLWDKTRDGLEELKEKAEDLITGETSKSKDDSKDWTNKVSEEWENLKDKMTGKDKNAISDAAKKAEKRINDEYNK